MSRHAKWSTLAALFTLLAPRAALAGEDVGVSWADCVVNPTSDDDLDGLDDACEFAVAQRFQPQLVFGAEETAPDRLPFWASRPDGYKELRIFYALSYYADAGDPTFGGVSGHDGDTEFIVLRVHNLFGTTWELEEGYLSAHYDTPSDSGGWYPYDKFEYVNDYRGQPVVYVAEGKHANYVSLADCDDGAFYQDHCSDAFREDVGIAASRDLGLWGQPLIDEYVIGGNSEWFWTDAIFCGWTRPPGDARDGCVPAGNTYSIELTTFEMDYGPVGSTPLCGACTDSIECADGGVCMLFDGHFVCGRECGGVAACPTGTTCGALTTGESQCVPDVACSCVEACTGKACGDDGCGGTCGTCPSGKTCSPSGQCVKPSGKGQACSACASAADCAAGLACAAAAEGQKAHCVEPCAEGACADGFTCSAIPEGQYCLPAAAPACHEGDVWSVDACGDAIAPVSPCQGTGCTDGVCGAACTPQCDGKKCGEDDGCGNPCGECSDPVAGQQSGCGCSTVGTESAGGSFWLLLAAAMLRRRSARR